MTDADVELFLQLKRVVLSVPAVRVFIIGMLLCIGSELRCPCSTEGICPLFRLDAQIDLLCCCCPWRAVLGMGFPLCFGNMRNSFGFSTSVLGYLFAEKGAVERF